MKTENIFQNLPADLSQEVFEQLAGKGTTRVERIVSAGQSAPEEGWFDPEDHEWVIVLQGEACLEMEGTPPFQLKEGDYVSIPAQTRHRVLSTSADPLTIWLAVHFGDER
ncbi:cupin domain-containing protein [Kiritimatiellaeota bacterium B1221]|nr:cupin domain-containing protein [Kiritimatiellaeota bacterium B1221]